MTSAKTLPNSRTVAPTYAAFANNRLVAAGPRDEVLRATKKHVDRSRELVLIFEEASGRQVDFDMRGSMEDVLARARTDPKPGPGRPRLGVVSREISLLPRHWDWLEGQPNGASAAIRRLVDAAKRTETGLERGRHVRNALGRTLWALAGNLPNFEEVARAIDAREDTRLDGLISSWPRDVRAYVFARIEVATALERA